MCTASGARRARGCRGRRSILTGYNYAASELGHMVIRYGGRLCTCGRHGCLEAYASATGLINLTNEAAAAHPDSRLAALAAANGGADGRTAFLAAKEGDAAGQAVVDEYIGYLACGVTNIINIFEPEVISLGGGIAKEGETLLAPLRERAYAEIFGGRGEKYTRITACTLGYKAGIDPCDCDARHAGGLRLHRRHRHAEHPRGRPQRHDLGRPGHPACRGRRALLPQLQARDRSGRRCS